MKCPAVLLLVISALIVFTNGQEDDDATEPLQNLEYEPSTISPEEEVTMFPTESIDLPLQTQTESSNSELQQSLPASDPQQLPPSNTNSQQLPPGGLYPQYPYIMWAPYPMPLPAQQSQLPPPASSLSWPPYPPMPPPVQQSQLPPPMSGLSWLQYPPMAPPADSHDHEQPAQQPIPAVNLPSRSPTPDIPLESILPGSGVYANQELSQSSLQYVPSHHKVEFETNNTICGDEAKVVTPVLPPVNPYFLSNMTKVAIAFIESLKAEEFCLAYDLFLLLISHKSMDEFAFKIAYALKDYAVLHPCYSKVSEQMRVIIEEMVGKLPISVRNIVFPPADKHVRIWNEIYAGEYLGASHRNPSDHHYAKVYSVNDKSASALIVEPSRNHGYFNLIYPDTNEILVGTNRFMDERREIVKVSNDGDIGDKSDWLLTPVDDHVMIQLAYNHTSGTTNDCFFADPRTVPCKSIDGVKTSCRHLYTWTSEWSHALVSDIADHSNLWMVTP